MTAMARFVHRLFAALATLLVVYMSISVFRFLQESSRHYSTFVLAVLLLSSLLALRDVLIWGPARGRRRFRLQLALAWLLMALSLAGGGYLWWNALRLEIEQPFLRQPDIVMGVVLLAAVTLGTWFHWGALLTGMFLCATAYFFWGHLIEHTFLSHPPFDVPFVMSYMGMNTTEGIFSFVPLIADTLFFLVLFSAVLLGSGMLTLVMELGKLVGRFVRGGAAFPAIVGSSMVGSVMGQAVSNVIMTGRLTIPMMKEHGIKGEMAGAIEAAASTAGQIIPPVLGLAAFIIAAFLNVPYITVALAATIPALLYVGGVTISVLVAARRHDFPRLHGDVDLGVFPRLLPTFLLSFGLVLALLLGYYSPSYAGFFGVLAVLALCPFQGRFRPSARAMWEAVVDGLGLVVQLGLLAIAVGPIGQVVITTGLTSSLSAVLVHVLPDNVLLLLVGTMVLSLVLGMGLPTPVAYIMVALTLAQFLQELGVQPLLAHFFVFYFAVFSTLTPPLAVSVLAAAKISGASFLSTAVEAMRLVPPTFIIPFAFVYHPSLLAFPDVSLEVLEPIGVILAVQWLWAVALYGFHRRRLGSAERLVFGLVGGLGTVHLVNPAPAYLWAFLAAVGAVTLGPVALAALGSGVRRAPARPDPRDGR